MKSIRCGLVIVVALMAQALGAQGDKPPTCKQIMEKLNKGENSLCPTLGRQLKASAPDWDEIQKETSDFARLAEDLGKTRPPRGPKGSWEKLCKSYAANATELDEASQKKDQKAALAVHLKLARSCKACHEAHRNN